MILVKCCSVMHARRRVNTGIIMFHSFIQVISIAPLQVHNTQYNTNQIYNARKITPKCESEARSNADSPVRKRSYGNPIISFYYSEALPT